MPGFIPDPFLKLSNSLYPDRKKGRQNPALFFNGTEECDHAQVFNIYDRAFLMVFFFMQIKLSMG
jgi:hypothetical protein